MQTWDDIRQRANLWDLLDELPWRRANPGIPDYAARALDAWAATGNMAHLGLGRELGAGNFSRVYELGQHHVVKITRIVSTIAAASGRSARSEFAMAYSGSLDVSPLYADFCMGHLDLDGLLKTQGYARHGDAWAIVTERLEPLSEPEKNRMNWAQGDARYIGERILRMCATLPAGTGREFTRALEAVMAWAAELDMVVPVYYDLHRENLMRRPWPLAQDDVEHNAWLRTAVTQSRLVISDPLVCYRG